MKKVLLAISLAMFFSGTAIASEYCITVPEAKDAKIAEARGNYNTRNGTSLTDEEYITQVVKDAVVQELVLDRSTEADTTIAVEHAAVSETRTTESVGWEE